MKKIYSMKNKKSGTYFCIVCEDKYVLRSLINAELQELNEAHRSMGDAKYEDVKDLVYISTLISDEAYEEILKLQNFCSEQEDKDGEDFTYLFPDDESLNIRITDMGMMVWEREFNFYRYNEEVESKLNCMAELLNLSEPWEEEEKVIDDEKEWREEWL